MFSRCAAASSVMDSAAAITGRPAPSTPRRLCPWRASATSTIRAQVRASRTSPLTHCSAVRSRLLWPAHVSAPAGDHDIRAEAGELRGRRLAAVRAAS
jgi:hypothetical protein